MSYIDQALLTARMGAETLLALCDDTGARDADDAGFVAIVAALIEGADARATSWFPADYTGELPFPAPIPGMVKELSFLYAEAAAYKRNPDYLAQSKMGVDVKSLLAVADKMGERLQSAILRMVDAPAPTPANVGGVMLEIGPRIWTTDPDGTVRSGDF